MKRKNRTELLNEAIILLETKQAEELYQLKEQFHITYESLRPVNLIKSAFREIVAAPEVKNNVLNNIVGLATGFLSRKVLLGSSTNPIKKMAGTLLQFAVANAVSRNSSALKSSGLNLLQRLFRSGKESREEAADH